MNIGDHGSSEVHDQTVVTPMQGLQRLLPDTELLYTDGSSIEEAAALAQKADAVVFVVGFDHDDEGEFIGDGGDGKMAIGGDRKHGLSLHADDVELLRQVGAVNPNTAAVLIGGNTITLEGLEKVPAILMAYYPCHEGGAVIADILFGKVNPSGKLPFVLPVSGDDLPQVNWITDNQYYDYYHGYQKLDHEGVAPALPYGFGLSYTTFAFSDADFAFDGETLTAKVTVSNTGDRAGDTVAQLYVGFPEAPVDRPVKSLRGFRRVSLAPGEAKVVTITCPAEKLAWYNPQSGWQLDKGPVACWIGSSEADRDLLGGNVTIS
jgi:beta-glucosidase